MGPADVQSPDRQATCIAVVLVAFIVAVVLAVAFVLSPSPRGDGATIRLKFYADPSTGCQYVVGPHGGGVAPRTDAAGKHVGCKEQSK